MLTACDLREALTRFHSRTPPAITIHDYLKRIVRYTNVEVRLFPFGYDLSES